MGPQHDTGGLEVDLCPRGGAEPLAGSRLAPSHIAATPTTAVFSRLTPSRPSTSPPRVPFQREEGQVRIGRRTPPERRRISPYSRASRPVSSSTQGAEGEYASVPAMGRLGASMSWSSPLSRSRIPRSVRR